MKRLLIYTGMALCLLIPGLLRGQEIGLLRVNPDSLVSQREAAIWGGFEEGRFKPVHGALTQWSAGAGVKSVRHGKNSSWTGALSLEQTTGYEMGASLLLEPDYFPLDIVETHLVLNMNGCHARRDEVTTVASPSLVLVHSVVQLVSGVGQGRSLHCSIAIEL